MSKTTIQKGTKIESGIKLHLHSISLPSDLFKPTDEVRISITSMPERNKQYYFIQGKKLDSFDHIFKLNITNKTEEIIIVLRKKDFIENDPIVASTVIHSEDFPEIPQNIDQLGWERKSTDIKTIDILEPRHRHDSVDKDRKTIGQLKAQMKIILPLPSKNKESTKNNNKLNEIFNSNGSDGGISSEKPKFNSYTEYLLL